MQRSTRAESTTRSRTSATSPLHLRAESRVENSRVENRRVLNRRMSTKFASYSAPSSSSSNTSETMIKVGYATDVEGNYDYWSRYIELSEILTRTFLGTLELAENCHFVFGGDVVDRGPGDLRVLSDLISLKRAYPDRVHFIMGNRDINKMRIPVELHPNIIKIPPKVYWLREAETASSDNSVIETQAEKLKWVRIVLIILIVLY